MHYLLFGRPADRADAFDRISRLLGEGHSATAAVSAAFGSVETLDAAYRDFQRRPITQFARLSVDTRINRDAFAQRTLTGEDAATMRALVHTAFNRPEDGRTALAQSRPGGTGSAESYVVEGMLLERERKASDALAAFARAVEMRSQSFLPYYRVGVDQSRPGGADNAAAERNFRQAIALSPAFAPAHRMLAGVLAGGPMPETALEPARRAVALDPSDSGTRLVYAYVLRRMGQLGPANGQALAARSLAQTDAERQQAQRMIDDIAAAIAKAVPQPE